MLYVLNIKHFYQLKKHRYYTGYPIKGENILEVWPECDLDLELSYHIAEVCNFTRWHYLAIESRGSIP